MLTHLINHPLGKRPAKPRQKGITMVLDTGLGLRELQDLLEIAGEYLDYLKLGFGTSLLYQPQLLQTRSSDGKNQVTTEEPPEISEQSARMAGLLVTLAVANIL